jgi:outer membrane autotransporter protein
MSALNAPLSLRRSPLAVAIGLACLMAHPVWAATLGPNESATVRAGETAETWFLSQRSQLTIGPGAETLQVYASNNSEVVVFGGKATSLNNEAAISLVNSRASIGNAELDSRTIGLSVSSTWLDPGMPSSAMVQDSRVTGGGAGALVDSGTLTVSRSEFSGGGVGIEMADGVLHVADDSIVRGDIGIDLLAAYFFARDLGNQVTIDDSHVEGVGGSAIVVRAENPNDPGKATQAEIIVRNGSTLTASNGVLVDAEAGANVGLTIDNSHLTGQLINLDRLGLANGARWTLTDHAQVGALSLDRSTIALGGGGGDFRVLEVDSLDGQGRFELGVDLAAHQGDLLKVQGRAEGEHELKIANSGQEPLAGDAPQNVVQTGGGEAQFALLGGQVEAGAYAYELARQGDDWALVQRRDERGRQVRSASTNAVLGLYNVTPVAWHGELAGLRSRFDELRRDSHSSGLWLRAQGARYSVKGADALNYQLRQSGFSLGADTQLGDALSVGVLAGTSRSNLDFSRGTQGNIDSVYLGTYATWLDADGYYVDALLKANRFSNRADVLMSDGVKTKGDYRAYALGGSVEAGRHWALADGWYVKPFGQLVALSVQGQDDGLDNGLQASNNATQSLTGKLGSQFGRRLEMAGGGSLQPYAKLAFYREFADRNQARVNNQTFANSLAGHGTEMGLGFSAQLTPAFQLNADVDYAVGQRVDQAYGVSAGLRYAF